MDPKSNPWGRITIPCEWCGEQFEVKLSKSAARRTCSTVCGNARVAALAQARLRSRFASKWVPDGDCHRWVSAVDKDGYGRFWMSDGRRSAPAHVIAYELAIGPVRPGLMLDHLCRHPWCVNPRHLEPVTNRVNQQRGVHPSRYSSMSLWCNNGHYRTTMLTRFQTDGKIRCRLCERAAQRSQREKKRGGWC